MSSSVTIPKRAVPDKNWENGPATENGNNFGYAADDRLASPYDKPRPATVSKCKNYFSVFSKIIDLLRKNCELFRETRKTVFGLISMLHFTSS